ncbi:conserved hypothetical protein [Methylocella silvestris BL2]|uniref:DNA primase/polymerase bifunctional N-terminal domain-containing protein n=1 Tax=Methylocella silvestris (strain DSM 15510 / CIP 108128 / LMG 27833 / NCIMB 13906 / BL2) TaxID=395965 RepID=B8EKZ7_METSB|nr:AAA family ATPase [Methylocella silvestris]ACK52025.1 conserved hypothetical protein [Methylocella silvestris BL2]
MGHHSIPPSVGEDKSSADEPAAPAAPPQHGSPSSNRFKELWDRGYRALRPLIPHDATMSESSNIRPELIGKIPGKRLANGTWVGFHDWQTHSTTDADLVEWASWGAGVGLMTGLVSSVLAVDIDTLDHGLSARAAELMREMLGPARPRVGRAPKALFLYRCAQPVPFLKVKFDGPEGKRELVELSTDRRQIVMRGTHPKTGKPYSWPEGLPPFKELTEVTPEQVEAFFLELSHVMPNAEFRGRKLSAGSGSGGDQTKFTGSAEAVARAVRSLPNTEALYPTRDSWLDMLYAIKAALPDDPGAAEALAQEWSEKYDGPDGNDPDYVAQEWRKMVPPFRRGASWLYEQAELHAPNDFARVSVYFDVIDEDKDDAIESLSLTTGADRDVLRGALEGFDVKAKSPQAVEAFGPDDVCEITEAIDPKHLPTRKWIVSPWLMACTASQVVGASKLGKSAFMLRLALAVATGKESILRGPGNISPERLHKCGPVIVYNAEDPQAEMQRRLSAVQKFHGVIGRVKHGITLWSGSSRRLIVAERKDGRTSAVTEGPGFAKLREMIRRKKPTLVILDPLVSLVAGIGENENDAMDAAFRLLITIAAEENTAILIVHHTGKTEKAVDDIHAGRGASASGGVVRGSLNLNEVSEKDPLRGGLPPGRYMRADMGGANYGPKIGGLVYRLKVVPVGNGTADWSPETADALFNEEDAEASLRRRGDTVIVHEIIDARKAAAEASAVRSGEEDVMRRSVASAALEVMGGSAQLKISGAYLELGKALKLAGIAKTDREQTIRNTLTDNLSGDGVIVVKDHKRIRVWAEKEGADKASPWLLRHTSDVNDETIDDDLAGA